MTNILFDADEVGEAEDAGAALEVATIAQKFRLTLAPDQRIVSLPSVTLWPKNGIKVVLEAR